jgi:3-dehydroquinate dehydratase/shikimate dehydrogenase
VEAGAAYVDCELLAAERFFAADPGGVRAASGTKIILSSHNYDDVPSSDDLAKIHADCVAAGADIVKIAAMVKDITHVARLEKLLADARASDAEATIVLGMGEAGQVSRLLAAKFGSFLTFGALRSGAESAPGQPTLKQLRELYRVPAQSAATKVLGVIGKPIAQSKSPALHNPSLAAAGVDACYVPLLVDDLGAFLDSPLFGRDDYAGFSVTIPHKEEALRCCAEVDEVAAKIGAVNTLVRRSDGTLKGYNTDYSAAIAAIERAMADRTGAPAETALEGKTVVVVGAGGAGRGLAFGAAFKGASVVVANRNYERAAALAEACGGTAVTLEALQAGEVAGDVLANTTSLGMVPNVDETPVPKAALEAGAFDVVFDAVYNPLETKLLREAKECGSAQASGLDMFVGQAAQQFELFTGEKAAKELMRDAVLESM